MRSFALILAASCGGAPTPTAKPTPPTPTTDEAPACPADVILIPKFRPLYTSSVGDGSASDELGIRIVSCEWGHWAGPSFLVHHSLPEQPNQEVDSVGGTAIVRADGTLVASRFGDGEQSVTVEGHDLDGDGNDEIFETTTFDGRGMAPISGSSLSISRVVGKDIVALEWITTKLETYMIEPPESCETTLEVRAVGTTKHVVIVARRTGEQFASRCLSTGRHELVLDGGKLKDVAPADE